MAKENKKNAFLILRVESSFKIRLMSKAKEVGKTVSEFVRAIVIEKM